MQRPYRSGDRLGSQSTARGGVTREFCAFAAIHDKLA
jgi:hypothetical protein